MEGGRERREKRKRERERERERCVSVCVESRRNPQK